MRTREIVVDVAIRRALVAQARRERPRECCGFLLGHGARVRFALATANVESSAVRYRIDDRAHIQLRRLLRGAAPPLEIVGVYHSHPAGDAVPSATDVAEAMYPGWIYMIVGLKRPAAIRAFRVRGRAVRELTIRWRRPSAR